VALRLFFTRTRTGITMRAVVDDRDLTARSGASPARTAQLSWVLGASLAALAGILIAGGRLQQLDQFNLTLLVISGYAAAVAGRLKSLPLTVAGAMVLGILVSYGVGYLPISLLSNFEPVIPMAMLFLILLVLPQGRLRTARFGSGKARRTTNLPVSIALGALFVGGAWVVAQVLSAGNLLTFGQGIVLGIVMLSLVLLTGYGGQVSLCQMTFAGVGAFCMGKILGGSSIVGLVAAFAIPALVGAVLALIVLRLRDIYLALATLAFAYAMDNMFFNRELGFGGILHVGRVVAHSQRSFLIEVAALFAVAAVSVLALKRGPFGRRLAALNDSEVACVSIGMSTTTTKVVAFTLAAGIAGLGGALYGGWQGQVGPADFTTLVSLILLLLIALGGLGTVAGAFAAALFYALQPVIQSHVHISNFTGLLVGLGAVSLGRNPGGVVGQVSDAVDRARAWSAERGRESRLTPGLPGEEADLVRVAG
ncbi:MAG TPA: ABC transporter permease, partial [Acidimicrobiales bacterium]